MEIISKGASLHTKAYAKVNLFLEVVRRREDNFHELDTVFSVVENLYDELSVSPAVGFSLLCDNSSIPLDESNLIIRAAKKLAVRFGVTQGASFMLQKNIPDGGGLGGGSSDAAAALVLCNSLWNCGACRDELLDIAAEVGSDVPFFLYGGVCHAGGRGEILTPLTGVRPPRLAILIPDWKIATPLAFKNLIADNFNQRDSTGIIAALEDGLPDFEYFSESFNRFEEAVFNFEPRQRNIMGECLAHGCRIRMSGSGSCCWLVPDSRLNALPAHLKERIIFPPC